MELREIVATGIQLTLSRAAYLLSVFTEDDFVTSGEYDMLSNALLQHASSTTTQLPCCKGATKRCDPRGEMTTDAVLDAEQPICVYTDYDFARDVIAQLFPAGFVLVDDPEQASYVLMTRHIKDFLSVRPNLRVSSFPYEGGFVRKDLLPLTIRRHCYAHSSPLADDDSSISAQSSPPSWWLPCYDLSTEFHLFAAEYERRRGSGEDNCWIVKPSQGTRAQGHTVVTSTMTLADVAAAAPQLPKPLLSKLQAACRTRRSLMNATVDKSTSGEGTNDKDENDGDNAGNNAGDNAGDNDNDNDGDDDGSSDGQGEKVAQLFVRHPLLALGKKFDVRVYVFVRSFQPFEAYMHEIYYARLANKVRMLLLC
jgi:hypothetical protein